jgi:hypothetical protein
MSRKEESVFFSEEKNQKTFASAWVDRYGPWPAHRRLVQIIKVFWFFSSEKNILAWSLP